MPVDKLHSEYRSTYRWHEYTGPRQEVVRRPPQANAVPATGELTNDVCNATKHKDTHNDSSELEPLVDEKNNEKRNDQDPVLFNTEYQKKFRPFSQYEYSEGRYTKKGASNKDEIDAPNSFVNGDKRNDSWYQEVVELRKKAGEYKSRGWGSDLASEKINDIYNKQVELWDQVSRRSSLSALSLASVAHKGYSKQDKEDNNKNSSSKAYRNADSAKFIRDIVRHHLERTTGGSELDGLILSPTREKLEPTIPRKDDDSRGSTKNSPKKSSPMKSSSLKRSNQRTSKSPRNIRSQSVGPTETGEKKSPKRQSRSVTVKERKSSGDNSAGRRPRPSDAEKIENEEDKTTPATEEKSQPISYEPVIKSPPEPTRVKSPEQIMMKSPDPVNWTVPLDTGKTFTVTQNVLEGDIGSRPHSEVKAWTPSEAPPPVAQSAPPSLVVLEKDHGLS